MGQWLQLAALRLPRVDRSCGPFSGKSDFLTKAPTERRAFPDCSRHVPSCDIPRGLLPRRLKLGQFLLDSSPHSRSWPRLSLLSHGAGHCVCLSHRLFCWRLRREPSWDCNSLIAGCPAIGGLDVQGGQKQALHPAGDQEPASVLVPGPLGVRRPCAGGGEGASGGRRFHL